MDAERWRRIDVLFAAALNLPPEEREAFLSGEVAAEDAELRTVVERLLAADGRAGTFLATPALLRPGTEFPAEDDAAGRRIGPYTLVRCLGRGGMGAVYLASRDDGAYDRQVAVKLLRWGFPDDELRHRFLAERQILARLEHPHIARLYDAGTTEDGQPYLVMEYVEGLPLDVYCDAHHLPVEERIRLFRKVCAAVQHAHRNLLVHRDLKPANVLVTAAGEPKLLDFGIAKQLASSDTAPETRTGLRLMTPSYASPEQILGETVTTASDVYSLGVLLYELVAGRSPYRTAGRISSVERAVLEEVPDKPSDVVDRRELRRRLRGDLDNIVLMALRKEPERRYGSAAELEQDLERFLARRPVAARRASFGYRAGLFVRRHRWAVAVGAAALLVITGLVAGLISQSVRAARERDKAIQALAFLVDVFERSDPYQTGGERVTPRQILAQGAARVSRELADQPEVQSALLEAIGQVYLGLGVPKEAEPLLVMALARRRATGAGALEIAGSAQKLGRAYSDLAAFPKAVKLYEVALALERRALGEDAPAVASTLTGLAEVYVNMERLDEAEDLLQQALAIDQRLGKEGREEAARVLDLLASLERSRARLPTAEAFSVRALTLQRQVLGPRHPEVAKTLRTRALIHLDMGDHHGAEQMLQEAMAIQRTTLEEGHPDRVATLNDLALAFHFQGRLDVAEALYRESLSLLRARLGDSHPQVANALNNIGSIAQSLERTEEAARLHGEALAIRRKFYGERHMYVAQSLVQLGRAQAKSGLLAEAESTCRRALEMVTSLQGADHPFAAYPLVDLGQIAMQRRRWKEAESEFRRALAIRTGALPAGHFETARVRSQVGESLVRQGRYAEAEPLLRAAWEEIRPQFPSYDKRVLDVRARLKDLYRSWGKEEPTAADPAASVRSPGRAPAPARDRRRP